MQNLIRRSDHNFMGKRSISISSQTGLIFWTVLPQVYLDPSMGRRQLLSQPL